MWGSGMGFEMGWLMWVVMILGTVGFWTLVVVVVRALIQVKPAGTPPRSLSRSDPMGQLDERLARGEIDAEEYQRTKNLLTGAR